MYSSDYIVRLFDSNSSRGVWQMVGVLGLRDLSLNSTIDFNTTDGTVGTVDEPTLPTSDTTLEINISNLYPELGSSEIEIDILKTFDTNLSNNTFDPVSSTNGELVLYSYDLNSSESRYKYYNSKNSDSSNQFSTLKTGLGYWVRFNNNATTSTNFTSNSGFIFNDNFNLGVSTYQNKIFSGWNLLSLPEIRTTEGIYIIKFEYNTALNKLFTISYRDDLEKFQVNIDENLTLKIAVNNINSVLNSARIFAFKNDSSVVLMSSRPFTISADTSLYNYNFIAKNSSTFYAGSKISSEYLNGLVLELNHNIINSIDNLTLSLNGTSVNLYNYNEDRLITSTISSIGLQTTVLNSVTNTIEDKNYTLVLSKSSFYIEDHNYIKSYYITETIPTNFYSDNSDPNIVYYVSTSKNELFTNYSFLSGERVILGSLSVADFITNLNYSATTILSSELDSASRYIKTYMFPKKDNLKNFLSSIFSGYLPTQILTLKSEENLNGKWDSLPISKNFSTWSNISSSYDLIHSIDRRKGYWVKFDPFTSGAKLSIDVNGTEKSSEIIHIVGDDNSSMTNLIHYSLQIPVLNLSKLARGYISVGNIQIELKPELDGSIFSAEINSEELSSTLNKVKTGTIYIIDEDGNMATSSISLGFEKPINPNSTMKLSETLADSSLRVFRDNLRLFDKITNIEIDLCKDFGTSNVYIVRTNSNDINASINSLILSDAIVKQYTSYVKGTSRLTTSSITIIDTPVKYSDNCIKISETPVATEGVSVGKSNVTQHLYYKKSTSYTSSSLYFPKVMYVKSGTNPILEIKFDLAYANQDFYIVDNNGKEYAGKFIADTYGSDVNPLYLNAIE